MIKCSALLLLAFILPTTLARADDAPPKPWFQDFAAARREAEKSNRPLLVVFRCTH